MTRLSLHLFAVFFSLFAVSIALNASSRDKEPKYESATSELARLLDVRIAAHSRWERSTIDAEIRTRFGRNLAVMVTDASGMTSLTKERGIFETMARIRQMHLISQPLIEAKGAVLIKTVGDDMFIVHDSARALYELALEIQNATQREAVGCDTLNLGMGIDYGEVLHLDGEDIWGDAVNIASKLGEDSASPCEILISETAWAQMTSEGATWTDCDFFTSTFHGEFPHWVCRFTP